MNNIEQIYSAYSNHYDEQISKIVPSYRTMLRSMVSAIPFSAEDTFTVVDLGCGTGNLTYLIKSNFPNAIIDGMDFSPEMIKISEKKLAEHDDSIHFETVAFKNFEFKKTYDVIASAIALHHLPSERQFKIYQRIYDALPNHGVFINAVHVLGANDELSETYTSTWADVMRKMLPVNEAENIINTAREIDQPVTLVQHFEWLKTIGFKDIDIVWKENQIAVIYGGK